MALGQWLASGYPVPAFSLVEGEGMLPVAPPNLKTFTHL